MRNQIDVDWTDQVVRAREREERRAGEIADVEKPELAELQANAGGPRILVRLLRGWRRRGTSSGSAAGAGQRRFQRRTRGADDDRLDALERNAIAGGGLEMPPLRAHRGVRV